MQQQRQYVGIDLHRRRSVVVRVDESGEHLSTVRVDNDAMVLAAEVAKAGSTRMWCSRRPMGGTGRWTCSRSWAPRCTWPTHLD